MQIAYRARSLLDAQRARDVLAHAGVAAHVADEELWNTEGDLQGADCIRVLVDNRYLDRARRALRRWKHAAGSSRSGA
jgi:hypothetical protein